VQEEFDRETSDEAVGTRPTRRNQAKLDDPPEFTRLYLSPRQCRARPDARELALFIGVIKLPRNIETIIRTRGRIAKRGFSHAETKDRSRCGPA
jgi:hypothetical protein